MNASSPEDRRTISVVKDAVLELAQRPPEECTWDVASETSTTMAISFGSGWRSA
jgi:hypothetical protein